MGIRWSWQAAAATALVLANFFWLTRGCLDSHFAPDEMMNMGWAWEAGGPKIAAQIVKFWEPFYRPTGALYYWTLYQFAHLNPVPFRVFDLLVMAANLGLAYGFVRQLTERRWVAFGAVLLFSYHQHIMLWAAFNGAWAYDRLCFTFSIAALWVYAWHRRTGAKGVGPRLAVMALFVLALGAKEMAVVLPGLLVVFEVVYFGALPRLTRAGVGFVVLLCGMSLLYAYGRTHGAEALAAKSGYRLKAMTVGNYLESQGKHQKGFFFRQAPLTAGEAGAVLAALALVAALARSPLLAFAVAFVVIAPVPIAFVDRDGGSLYIPLLGWCLFASGAIDWATRRLPRPPLAFLVVLAAAYGWLTVRNLEYWKDERAAMLSNGDVTWRVIGDLNRIRPDLGRDSKVFVQQNPFEGWDMAFILMLWSNQHGIEVRIVDKNAPEGAAMPGLTGIFTLDPQGHLIYRQLKR